MTAGTLASQQPDCGDDVCIVPFVACGDLHGYDADSNYDLDCDRPYDERYEGGEGGEGGEGRKPYVYHEPVQKPTTPAYR